MAQDIRRYFIEPQMATDDELSRNREAEVRRVEAEKFLEQIASWLDGHDLQAKVVRMAITAMGQVQITCERDLINRLCEDDQLPIAAVRSGGTLS
jgi:hypothetical protein